MQKSRKIIVSVTSDLVSDNRVHKTCTTLSNNGFDVTLIGRKLINSLPIDTRIYKIKRFRLLFNKGFLFYAEFNIRLFMWLLFNQYDMLLSNDLDTLSANAFAKIFKKKPLIYDSHEYFTEVPELINRPKVKKFWSWVEKKAIKYVDSAYTVCDSIAQAYQDKYSVKFEVIRNLPLKTEKVTKTKTDDAHKIVLYQGAINIGRGLKQAILATKYIENTKLLIAGDGDIYNDLKNFVNKENLSEKVIFLGKLPIDKLKEITPTADLGLSIEEDMGLNYQFALPNKLFDYIQAQVPVLVSNLPEMKNIVNKYQIGRVCDSLEPENLANCIKNALSDDKQRLIWKENLKKAATELTWESEEQKLLAIFTPYC